ncbi:LEM3/CDC50 family protein [Aspergillus campestris IBT 28561]|uniref:LEM3/CDC50 family protein n=1 Tax=Aspergillus campestris (strain IBT 28561) TaxID=1392248 RepID=A0A2I1D3L2_ASPC2|nr:LEM3/CDC50 family protein [Aspergillus campestris IBT 28561]PKY04448.1 LEM3/CDC50 family protein [Aspergillus campestris IBT 28561]
MAQADPYEEPGYRAEESNEKTQVKKPKYNDFAQQRLKAFQPMLTPKTVLPVFFSLAIFFSPLGGVLLWGSNTVQEIQINYTDCLYQAPAAPDFSPMPKDNFALSFGAKQSFAPIWQHDNTTTPKKCTLRFDIPDTMGPPVFLYYQLTNFYQNHRKYTKSLNIQQLQGDWVSNQTINGGTLKCDPAKSVDLDCETGKAYYPAGAIANSMFNDTFDSPQRVDRSGHITGEYPMTNKGIAWKSDREQFKPTKYKNWEVVPPRYWVERYPGGVYTDEHPIPNLQEWEEFHVWMRTAALPNFSKMALRNDDVALTPGTYELEIGYRFPVIPYEGTKSILLTTRTVVGGKNSFAGIAYVAVGALCCLVGVVFTLTAVLRPRKVGDDQYLSWNRHH